jgi:hypothetical protein
MPNKPILALDFDGVIHRYSKGWADGTIYDPPTEGFAEWLPQALEHFTVIIVSSRINAGGAEAIIAWMDKHNIPDRNRLIYSRTRPPAFITIDDRAVTFTGDWGDYPMRWLTAFKPWHEKRRPTAAGGIATSDSDFDAD